MNAVYIFDFTLKQEGIEYYEICNELNGICKKYVFQLEEGKEGYKHYQGRISLITKKRINQMIKFQPWTNHAHFTITSARGAQDVEYVTKVESRIAGPWHGPMKQIFIPSHIKDIVLRPWQESLINLCNIYEKRKIYVIIDYVGNIGKSTLCTYMRCHGLGRIIPPMNEAKDIMRMVCNMKISNTYLIDMPKALPKIKLNQLYSAIESVKSGYAYDDRYRFKEKIFNIPNIVVFTNVRPDRGLLSNDRWELLSVIDNNLTSFLEPSGSLDESDDSVTI